MAVRTTNAAVRGIIETDPNISMDPFILAANRLTDRAAAYGADWGRAATAGELASVETWLAAHFYAHRDQLYTQRSTGKASGSFQGKTGMGLDSTQYGQTAKDMDPTGYLRAMSKGGFAGLFWGGTEEDAEESA